MGRHGDSERDKDVMTARQRYWFAGQRRSVQPAAAPSALVFGILFLACTALPAAGQGGDTGALTLTPLFKASTKTDRAKPGSLGQSESSWMNLVDAGMALRFATPTIDWEVSYQAAAARHELETEKKYLDHSVAGQGALRLGESHSLRVRAARDVTQRDDKKSRSKGIRRALAKLDTYARTEVGVTYQFGGTKNPEPLGATVTYSGLEYESLEDNTAQAMGYSEAFLAGAVSLQLMEDSALLFELSRLETIADAGSRHTPLPDSTRDSLLTGIAWRSSARTSGVIKVGYLRRELEAHQREIYAVPNWEVELAWSPSAFSALKVESQRYDQETASGEDIIDIRRYGIDWTRRWQNQWSLQIAGTYRDEAFGRIEREQSTVQLDTALRYTVDRRLQWSLGYRWEDRDSNIENLRMGRNQIEFSAKLVL